MAHALLGACTAALPLSLSAMPAWASFYVMRLMPGHPHKAQLWLPWRLNSLPLPLQVPTAPKRDMVKLLNKERIVLRFRCRLLEGEGYRLSSIDK